MRGAAATAAFSGAKVVDASGAKLAAARHGVGTAVSRAEAARTKGQLTLVSQAAGNAGHEAVGPGQHAAKATTRHKALNA